MGFRLGVSGLGSFAQEMLPLFILHPLIDEVVGADPIQSRREAARSAFDIATCESQEQLLDIDRLDAIAIFTQRWLHGPQAVQALDAGRMVYSAVPAAITVEEMEEVIGAVERNNAIYMLGETSFYYSAAVYCRARFRQGDFGTFVYGEGEYYHDMEHGFYPPYKGSNGPRWKEFASFPPMLYSSHSVSMVVGTTGELLSSVSCLGFRDRHHDGIFNKEQSHWNNEFSNESALFRTSGGGLCRINEFRRTGYGLPPSVRVNLYGTRGCFEQDGNGELWTGHDRSVIDVTEELKCRLPSPIAGKREQVDGYQSDFTSGMAPVHPKHRLPSAYADQPSGHMGSHQFLIDDFARACDTKTLPPNHAWQAARYCIPGIIAHQSAIEEGARLDIPDFGDAPDSWERLHVATY